MAKSAFFSFHYDRDAWRVQQVINMGKLEVSKRAPESVGNQ